MRKKLGCPQYSLLQATLWASYGIAYSYINRYLLFVAGMNNTSIGVLLGIATGAAFLLQPLIAGLVDGVRVTVRRVLLWNGVIQVLSMLGLLFAQASWLIVLCYSIEYAGLLIIAPFANAIGIQTLRASRAVNLGFSRGLGSLGFAATVQLTGWTLQRYESLGKVSYLCVPLLTMLVSIVFTAVVLAYPKVEEQGEAVRERRPGAYHFLRKYPAFILFLLSLMFSQISHATLRNAMYQIAEWKGDANAQGTALSVAAFLEIIPMFLFLSLRKWKSIGFWMLLSSIFYLVRNLLLLLVPGIAGLYIGQCAQMLSGGIGMIAVVYYVSESVEDADMVCAQAYAGAAGTVGSLIAYVSSGYQLDHMSISALLLVSSFMAAFGVITMQLTVRKPIVHG
ncbi:MAG: MFS transporter [Eubacteriales bacterium]|nr:MFS transporter [Eubacteriales bacterium]